MTDNTTTHGLERAREVYRGDWDGDGAVPVHLPRNVALELLEARGWIIETRHTARVQVKRGWPETYDVFVAPDHSEVYELDEAVQLAITAEVVV